MGFGERGNIAHQSFHRAQQVMFGINGSVVDEAEEIAKNMLAIRLALYRLAMPGTHMIKQNRFYRGETGDGAIMGKHPFSVTKRVSVFNSRTTHGCPAHMSNDKARIGPRCSSRKMLAVIGSPGLTFYVGAVFVKCGNAPAMCMVIAGKIRKALGDKSILRMHKRAFHLGRLGSVKSIESAH